MDGDPPPIDLTNRKPRAKSHVTIDLSERERRPEVDPLIEKNHLQGKGEWIQVTEICTQRFSFNCPHLAMFWFYHQNLVVMIKTKPFTLSYSMTKFVMGLHLV